MDDYRAVAKQFRGIKNSLSAFFTQLLPQYQISPIMMYTLEFLRKHPDCIAVDIAAEFGLTRGAVTQMLDKLENRGFVIRKPHPTSRRSLLIHVTEQGHALIAAIIDEYNSKIETLLTDYSQEELQALKQLLEKLPI